MHIYACSKLLLNNKTALSLSQRPSVHPFLPCCSSRPSDHHNMASDDTHDGIKHEPTRRVLSLVNESTKWTVSSLAALFLIFKQEPSVLWALLGSIVSSFINKALKKVINQQRPASARKEDPGMPSSHANSLAFLGTYSSLALAQYYSTEAAVALFICSMFLTWLRVALGYHTYPQVIVGFCLGSTTAIGWRQIGLRHFLPFIDSEPVYGRTLLIVTYGFGLLFAAKNLLPWIKNRIKETKFKAT